MKLTTPPRTAVANVRDEFDRFLDRFWNNGLFGTPARSFETMWSPSLDFSENEKEYVARLEVAGIPKEDLDVNVDGRTLTISGSRSSEKEDKGEDYFWREREQGRFLRTVQLPSEVDAAKVTATSHDGTLTVRLPKTEATVKNRIQIK